MRETERESDSLVWNWWCNCWLLVGSYLGSSGPVSGRAGFFLTLQSLSQSLGVHQIWQSIYLSLFFPFVFLPICLSSLLSPFCHIIEESSHWAARVFSFFLPLPALHRGSHAESSGLEESSRRREGGSAASQGSKVSLQQDRGGWGGTCRLFHLLHSTQARPTPQQQSYCSRNCWHSWAQRRSF